MALDNTQIRQKLEAVKGKISELDREKAQLEVKRDDYQKKVTELEPQVQELFGTTDSEELAKVRDDLLKQLEELNLDM